MLLTFACVAVGWAFFRAATLEAAARILGGMAGLHGLSLSDTLEPWFGCLSGWGVQFNDTGSFDTDGLRWIAGGFLIAWILPNTQQWMGRPGCSPPTGPAARVLPWRAGRATALLLAAMALLCLLRMEEVSEFLYFQF
jgi:hypothetical protein